MSSFNERIYFTPEAVRLYTPEAVVDIRPDELPMPVAEFFIRQSAHLVRSSKLPIDRFDRLMKLDDGSGSGIFFAKHDKYYDHIDATDSVIYEVDIEPSEKRIVGYGEFFMPLDGQAHLPSVMRTRTDRKYQQQGLGTRRLLAMNAAALKLFGLPLNSDSLLSYSALHTWQRLVRLGLAEEYMYEMEGWLATPRYRFLSKQPD